MSRWLKRPAPPKVESVEREFFNVFIGVGRGELLPYGSYYLTGFLHERPLARLRDDLNALGIERGDGNAEPEDNAAMLCEIMAGLADGTFPGARREPTRECSRITSRPGSAVSSPISSTRRRRISTARWERWDALFVDIETEAFALPS